MKKNAIFSTLLTMFIAPTLALCIPTPIKGKLSNATGVKLTIVYQKEFLVSSKAEVELSQDNSFNYQLDIKYPTPIKFLTEKSYFMAYAYPGIPLMLSADVLTQYATVVYSGELSTINGILSDLTIDPEYRSKAWTTGGNETLTNKIEQINEFHRFRKQYISGRIQNLTLNKASKEIRILDSIADEYRKAAGYITLIKKHGLRELDAQKLIADNLPKGILNYPDKVKLAIPEVLNFWNDIYMSYLVGRDAEKIKDLYKTHGYFLSALTKFEKEYPQPLRGYAVASMLSNLLYNPSDFRPGADSLVRRVKLFLTTASIPNGSKLFLEKQLSNVGANNNKALQGLTLYNLALKDVKSVALQWGRFKDSLVLIDCWAGWCGPCIAQFPAMEKVKAHFKNKKLSLVMVSFDKTEQDWKNATTKHKLQGHQYFSPKAFDGEFASTLLIKGIPRYILVKNGLVINPETLPPSDEGMITQINEALDKP